MFNKLYSCKFVSSGGVIIYGTIFTKAFDLLPCAAEGEVGECAVRIDPVARIFNLKIPARKRELNDKNILIASYTL